MPLASETPYRSFMDQTLHYFGRPHAGIPGSRVDSPADWMGRELRETAARWRVLLSDEQINELSAVADALITAGVPMAAVTATQFPLPALEPVIKSWAGEITHGRGFVVVRGPEVEIHSASTISPPITLL